MTLFAIVTRFDNTAIVLILFILLLRCYLPMNVF